MFLVLENGVLKESTHLEVFGMGLLEFADYEKEVLQPAGFDRYYSLSTSPDIGPSLQVYKKDDADVKKGTSKFRILVDYDIGDSEIHSVGVNSELELHMVLAIVVPIVSGMVALRAIEESVGE